MNDNILARFKKIRTFIFDVDGVLTDGSLLISESGELLRTMNAHDGMAMRMAFVKKYNLVIITGGRSEGVKKRLKGLGIDEVHIGIYDKKDKLEELLMIYEWPKESILYMGDDINDYEVMQEVGLPCCPADAAPEIAKIADYMSLKKGGKGCVRDVIEKVLKLNDDWLAVD